MDQGSTTHGVMSWSWWPSGLWRLLSGVIHGINGVVGTNPAGIIN